MLEAIETTALETQQRVTGINTAMEKAQELVKAKAPKIYQTMPQCSHHKPSFRRSLGVALVGGEAASARSAVTPARFAAQYIA